MTVSNGHDHSQPALAISNLNRKVLPGARYLDDLVASNPEQDEAIVYLDANGTTSSMSYASLHSASWQLARRIQSSSDAPSKPGFVVPVIIPQGPLLYIAYLGVLRAGAAFCPILTDTPDERLQFIVSDVQADRMLCPLDMVDHLKSLLPSIRLIPLNSTHHLDQESILITKLTYEPSRQTSDIAYVMYTSGSTGKPKGVPVSHEAVTQSLLAHDEHIPPFTRFFQFAAPTFDVSIFDIFFPLFRGATLACCERETTLADLSAILRNLAVDAVELTPTVAATLLRSRTAVPSLRLLMTIGEMLSPHILKEFGQSELQRGILYAMYGPTEAAIHCTIVPSMKTSNSVQDIGRPLSTVTAFILKEATDAQTTQIVPFGEVGELALAGQLADGYLNRPAQTEAAFVNLPDYGLVYRTGDRAVMASDGTIQIQGRISGGQVKLRGQRVELGEIESVALQVDGVDLAVAIIVQDTVVLFCCGQSKIQSDQVLTRCKSWLPRHMRPGDIVVLNEGMPRLSSGKVDRKNLERIYQKRYTPMPSDESNDEDEDSLLIKNIVSQELGISLKDNTSLWSAGLNSLRAIRIASRLREHYNDVSISTVLGADTLSQLITTLERRDESTDWSENVSVTSLGDDHHAVVATSVQDSWVSARQPRDIRVIPCSKMQIAMLAETLRNPVLNFNEIIMTSKRALKLSQLFEMLTQLAKASPILGVSFESTSDLGMPFMQTFNPNPTFDKPPSLYHPLSVRYGKDDRWFVVTIHHAIYDGWSWDIIMRDLNTLLDGGTVPTRPSFETFSRLVSCRSTENLDQDLTAWTGRLQGVEFHNFPTLCSTPPETPGRSFYETSLSISTSELSKVALDLRINMATIVQTALSLLLTTYLDTEIVVTGTVLAGREPVMPQVEEVVGPCLLTLPLLARCSDSLTIRDLALQVYQQHLFCLRHSSVDLADIASALSLAPGARLFDVLLVWQESLYPSDRRHDTLFTTANHDNLDYPLVIEAEPQADSTLHLKITFNNTTLSHDQVICIHSQIDALITRLARAPNTTVSCLWDDMPESLLSISHFSSKSPPADLTSTLADTALMYPERIAIDFIKSFDPTTKIVSRETVTYAQLFKHASQVAGRLIRTYKLQRDDIVAICCDKSPRLYVAIYAIILAGAAYLCIDPKTPESRVREIVGQATPKLVVVDDSDYRFSQALSQWLPAKLGNVTWLDANNESSPGHRSLKSDLAYVVFTSGSTGVPKGVLVTRENLASNIQHLSAVYPHNHTSRLLQSCSQAFDVSVFEIFWTWCTGVTLCSATNDVLFKALDTFINALEITHLSMTPSVAALVDPRNVPRVVFLVCAGEPMSAKVYESWISRGLHQGYGPSETTNICNVRQYPNGPLLINNVGPAFPNTSLFVCSRQSDLRPTSERLSLDSMRILPYGALGEVWIGGQQVCRGYTSPELTRQNFLDHPQYGRLFKSGDFGRLLPDRSLLVAGREDDQVKIRGQRLELNEINTRLMQSNYVLDSFTMILSTEHDRQKLVAFWVHESAISGSLGSIVEELYDHLHDTLASYMIPESLIPVLELPLTSQGKVDKRALLTLHNDLRPGDFSLYSPSQPTPGERSVFSVTEQKIASVLADLVQVTLPNIKAHDSFFSYGIDSIRAIAFARKLNDAGFTSAGISDILRYPSVSRLASILEKPGRKDTTVNCGLAVKAVPADVQEAVMSRLHTNGFDAEAILPCTPLQEAMLSVTETSTGVAYANHIVYHLARSTTLLRQAWSAMVDRHDLLRTMFVPTDHERFPYIQAVLKDFQLPWQESDDHEPSAAGSPFERPPYTLHVRDCGSRVELHLFMHHALYDAEALTHLQADVESFCSGGELVARPPFSLYLDFMLGTDERKSRQFWRGMLRRFVPCHLTGTRDRPSIQGRIVTRNRKNAISCTRLSTYAKQNSLTTLAVLQSALAKLISTYTHATDVCFGTVFSGRNVDVSEVEKIIGPCFNTLPLRVRLRESLTNTDLCQKFHDLNISVLPFQATSLRDLQRQYSQAGVPLLDVLLLQQSTPPALDSRIWRMAHEEGHMAFPFIFEVQHNPELDTVDVYLHNTTSANIDHLDNLLEHFVSMIIDTVERPDMLVSKCSFFYHLPALTGDKMMYTTEAEDCNDKNVRTMENTLVSRKVIEKLRLMSKNAPGQVNPASTIFHLGFDSISIVQLAAQLRKDGFQVSAGDLLDASKIYKIVELCERQQKKRKVTPNTNDMLTFDRKYREGVLRRLGIKADNLESLRPCTATQVGILSEYSKSQGQRYYNSLRLRLEPQVDIAHLHEKIREVVGLHDMLRTGFVELDDSETPYAMVLYSHTNSLIRYAQGTESIATDGPSTRSPQDLSQPPWYVEVFENEKAMYVEIHILHALYDARSMKIILQDLAALYRGSPYIQRPSVAAAVDSIIASNKGDCDIGDILQSAKVEVQATLFPDLNISRSVASFSATAKHDTGLNLKTLQQRCKMLGCSLSIALQAAWAQLLAVYTGQSSVVFGNVYSGRAFEEAELDEVVFPCINTLPIFVNIAHEEIPIIEQISKFNARWQMNPHIPLSRIKRSLSVEGDLFDTILVLQNSSLVDPAAPWQLDSEEATAEYAISLEVVPVGDSIKLLLTYDRAVLPAEHASILLQQYEREVCKLLNRPEEVCLAVDSLLSVQPPRCDIIPSDQKCLHDFVLASAEKHPHRIALEFVTDLNGDVIARQKWTYEQMISEASRIANLLVERGSCKGDMIALCAEKSPQASVALLGILMVGCTYVAIDPNSPASRRDFIIGDAHCKIMLTSSSIASTLQGHHVLTILCLDDDRLLGQQKSHFDLATRLTSPQDICYCLYTSGTTGTPKGCLITHESAVQAMMSFSRIFKGHWTEDSKWLQFAAYHFDVSVLEHFWSWKEGICVTVVPRDLLFEDLPQTINKIGITHLDLTPSLARLLTPETVPSLRQGVFIVGGEQVRQDIIECWGDAGCLYNFYGPSEVTIGCTVHSRVQKHVKPTNIGNLWDNVGAYVLEPGTQEPVPLGAVGELCLSGVLVGKGYLNRPELTREKFIDLSANGERIYRTGDLVRMLHDHSFDFLGRIDDQVKLRGQRLEIGEINHVILQCSSSFQDVATVIVEHLQQQKQHLVAFVAFERAAKRKRAESKILHHEQDYRSIDKLRREVANRLPNYMIPTYFVTMNFLPLTVNNKVDLKSLRSMYEQSSLSDIREQQQPCNAVSKIGSETYSAFTNTITDYLGIDRDTIGPHESLLQLGIDSISVIGLVRALKRAGFASASIITILKRPIVADLAAICCAEGNTQNDLQQSEQEEAQRQIVSFSNRHTATIKRILQSPTEIEHVAPCTSLQEGMISRLMINESSQPPYMAKFIFKLNANIESSRLQVAWEALQSQLDILRTRFVLTDDGFAQVVLASNPEPALEINRIEMPNDDDQLATIHKHFETWVQSTRDLGSVRPWGASILQHDSGQSLYMSLFMFHGLYDGISIQAMFHHLQKLYEIPQAHNNVSQFFEALPFGPLLRKHDSAEFWSNNLQHIRLLDFPMSTNSTDQTDSTNMGHCVILALEIRPVCSTLGVTPQAIFHAAWLITLGRRFNLNPTVGIVLSGRSIEFEHADQIIGPMFNTLPFSIDDQPQSSHLTDLIRACHEKHINTLPHQHASLSRIRKHLKLASNQELFNSLFVYQATSNTQTNSQEHWVEFQTGSSVEYPLNVEVEELEGNRYSIRIVAKSRYLAQDEVHRLLESFKTELENMSKARSTLLPECFYSIQPTSHKGQSSAPKVGNASEDRWTTDAKVIRTVLAELACTDATQIALHSPTIFELGLDSVDALKLVARLKGQDIQLSVSRILRYPTVAGILAQHNLRGVANLAGRSEASPFQDMQTEWRQSLKTQNHTDDDISLIIPTTPLQQGLLLEFDKYFHTMVFKVNKKIDLSRLIRSVHDSGQAMAILRTSFVAMELSTKHDSKFWQVIRRPSTGKGTPQISYRMKDVKELREFVTDLQGNANIADSIPKLRIACLEGGENYLVLALSHASYDAWSTQSILRCLEGSYVGDNTVRDDTQLIANYVHRLQAEHNSTESGDFWSIRLRNAIPSLVDVSKTDESNLPAILRTRTAKVSLERTRMARKSLGITLQSLGIATWTLLLTTLIRRLDISFGVVVSGRIDERTEALVFPTFNTITFRACPDLNGSKRELLLHFHNEMVKIFEHQQFPLSKALGMASDRGGNLFNTLFTFQKTPSVEDRAEKLFEEVDLEHSPISPPYAINVELRETDTGLDWTIAVQEDVMSSEDVEDVLSSLDQILGFLVSGEDEEVFRAHGDEVSVCGLPAIALKKEEPVTRDDIERSAIPSISDDRTKPVVEGWSTLERQIRDVFSKVSGVNAIDILKRTSLYHLGLDSVSAIKISKLLKDSGIKAPISMILRHQTIAKIASAMENAGSPVQVSESKPELTRDPMNQNEGVMNVLRAAGVVDDNVEDVLPASGGQIYMLDMWRASKGKLFYATFSFEVKHCDQAMFGTAFSQLVREIPALRSRFVVHDDRIYEVMFNPNSGVRGPVRFELMKHGSGLIVALHIHHALYDAISLSLMVLRLRDLCSTSTGMAKDESRLMTNQQPLINALQLHEVGAQQFWMLYLRGMESRVESRGTFAQPRTELFIPKLLRTASLESVARREGVSIQAILFASIARIHAQRGSRCKEKQAKSVVIGIYLANRSLDVEGLSKLVVPTFNIVPLRITTDAPVDIITAAKKVQADLQEVTRAEHCGVSLRDIHTWTGVTIDCYVNFLRLLETDAGTVRTKHQQGAEVEIDHAEGELREYAKALIQADKTVSPYITGDVLEDGGAEWCLPALDVEAKVDEQGNLAVGMFAPEGMFDDAGVESLMDELLVMLQGIGGL